MNDEKNIKKITIEYDNGETSAITKGFIAGFSNIDEKEKTVDVKFTMCNIEGKDLQMIVSSILTLVNELGMLE